MRIKDMPTLLYKINDIKARLDIVHDFEWFIVLFTELFCILVAKWAISVNKVVVSKKDKENIYNRNQSAIIGQAKEWLSLDDDSNIYRLFDLRNSLCYDGICSNLNYLVSLLEYWGEVISILKSADLDTTKLITSLIQTKWYQSVSAVEAKGKSVAERTLIGVHKELNNLQKEI